MSKKTRLILAYIFLALSILMNGFLVFQSCLPANSSMEWSNVALNVAKEILPSKTNPDGSVTIWNNVNGSDFIRKLIGHFSFYLIDGALVSLFTYFLFGFTKNKNLSLLIILIVGVLFSILTEIIQIFVPGRAGDITDMLLNLSGYLLGCVIVILIVYLIYRHKKKKTTELLNN